MCSSLSQMCEAESLDGGIEKEEIAKFIQKLKKKTGGSGGLVGELLKYGGLGMVNLLEHSFGVVWQEEVVPKE